MKTNRIKTLLTAVLLSLCASVSAYDFTVDSLYYNIVSLEDLTCEITQPYSYHYYGDIVIPETVTYNNKTLTVVGISSNAFSGCRGLSSVIIPKTVTYINDRAFEYCETLSSITIPNSVKYIGGNAFYKCENLNDIVFEDGDEPLEWKYDEYTEHTIFYGCPIDSLYIGRNLWCTNDYELFTNSSVKKLTIGNTITEIEDYSFYRCKNLTIVYLSNSVTTIGEYAFFDCNNLTKISLPNSVSTIGGAIFKGCTNLTEVSFGNSITTIDVSAFMDCIYNHRTTKTNQKYPSVNL